MSSLSEKTKTANLITRIVNWRIRLPSVSARENNAVIELLKNKGISRFLRTKEEIGKEAMLADPDVRTILGIKIVSGIEDFVIKPFEQEMK